MQSSASHSKDYVSKSNLDEKARLWLEEVRVNSCRRRHFDFSPECAALLIIDMQEYFLNPKSHAFLPGGKAILPNVVALLSAFRAAKLPVFFTNYAVAEGEDAGSMERFWGDVLREGDPMANIIPELAPLPGEHIIRKPQYDSFYGTDLERKLKAAGAKRVVVCGVLTDLCCETTARSAFVRGFDVFFCADGTATANEQLHVSALRTLAHGFGEVVSCRDIISKLQ
ncbi:MAG: isochorismatase family protein [Candidatus Thermoplasmatota archaeon]|nr:isochorismatase family protein [Candidatus Thermoplasmatota archaeon]